MLKANGCFYKQAWETLAYFKTNEIEVHVVFCLETFNHLRIDGDIDSLAAHFRVANTMQQATTVRWLNVPRFYKTILWFRDRNIS